MAATPFAITFFALNIYLINYFSKMLRFYVKILEIVVGPKIIIFKIVVLITVILVLIMIFDDFIFQQISFYVAWINWGFGQKDDNGRFELGFFKLESLRIVL